MDADRTIEELDRYQSTDEVLSGCSFATPMDELIARRRLAVVFRAVAVARRALASSEAARVEAEREREQARERERIAIEAYHGQQESYRELEALYQAARATRAGREGE